MSSYNRDFQMSTPAGYWVVPKPAAHRIGGTAGYSVRALGYHPRDGGTLNGGGDIRRAAYTHVQLWHDGTLFKLAELELPRLSHGEFEYEVLPHIIVLPIPEAERGFLFRLAQAAYHRRAIS